MTSKTSRDAPVLIAGGGPVGMTLALELARLGVASTVLEQSEHTTRYPKMDLTNVRSMELYRRLGLAERLRDVGVPREHPFDIQWMTSLSGHELHRFRYPSAAEFATAARRHNDGNQPCEAPLRVSQVVIEPVLKAAIEAEPLVDARFGVRVERVVGQDRDGVDIEARDLRTDRPLRLRTAYLAGCDGGSSAVRESLGIALSGDFGVANAYMIHFRSRERALLQRWGVTWHSQSALGALIAQDDDEIYTLQAWVPPGADPTSWNPSEVLERWAGRPFEHEVLLHNPWSAHMVVAERYVDRRVALAGDAAHQFMPTGGYGMNSGVCDAVGLAWVLAALLQGWGGPRLLEAYDAERRPTAHWHRDASRRHLDVRMRIAEIYASAGDLEGEDAAAAARRTAAGARIAALGNAENESWGVELGFRYDRSPIVAAEADAPAVDPLAYQASTWPGARLPQVFLADGSSLFDRLGTGFTLVVVAGNADPAFAKAATARHMPLAVLRLERPDLLSIYERRLLLVRPDQHIAWRGDEPPRDIDGLLAHVTGT
ncbi:MAG: FAD-dependent monooxygenase [Gammaproteobacteria bacterium]